MEDYPILYLNEGYCTSFEELQSIIDNNASDESFRKELLASFSDNALGAWISKQGRELKTAMEEEYLDDRIFGQLYEEILGKKCTIDLSSPFVKVGTLKYIMFNGEKTYINGTTCDGVVNKGQVNYELTFIFESKMASSSIFEIRIENNKGKTIISNTLDWSKLSKGQEKELKVTLTKEQILNPFYIVEGKDNRLCTFNFRNQKNTTKGMTLEETIKNLVLEALAESCIYGTEINLNKKISEYRINNQNFKYKLQKRVDRYHIIISDTLISKDITGDGIVNEILRRIKIQKSLYGLIN